MVYVSFMRVKTKFKELKFFKFINVKKKKQNVTPFLRKVV